MSEDLLNIEIDGKALKARKGQMIIQVADEAGINIPRFCYHKKLSIAANCRMCLVEVQKAPKPLPACATPVMEGMKVFTESKLALDAQKGVMEFLLINHPLDCPICDQGGECELQDIAMGYGGGISRYSENKRVVKDKDIGSLIATEMTRCIHCTRCVRFGDEIAGIRELGATGRGEFMQIGTYIENAVTSEMSGNVIDLCPVGALTAKPSRFNSRAWELMQHTAVAPHDGVGSNLYMHTLRGEIKRVVPRENEAINETWLSDRDRFSYEGIFSTGRLKKPMIKSGGHWQETDWETALEFARDGLQRQIHAQGSESIGAWAGAHSTLEEFYLFQKLMRGLGCHNIDHRLRQIDFSDQSSAPVMPWLGMDIADLENQNAFLLIASNLRKDQPIIANRVRKAVMKGAQVSLLNGRAYDWHFPIREELSDTPAAMVWHLVAIAKALSQKQNKPVSKALSALLTDVDIVAQHESVADSLLQANKAVILLGSQATLHPHFALLRFLGSEIAMLAGCSFGTIPESGNSAGAWLAGCIPHRTVAGEKDVKTGLTAAEMVAHPLSAYVLLNIEPEFDSWNALASLRVLKDASFVVSLTPYVSDTMKTYADVLLPIGTFAETAGTFVNVEGRWQSMNGVCSPVEAARPAWKVLRVLANLMKLDGFEYLSVESIREELAEECSQLRLSNNIVYDSSLSFILPVLTGALQRIAEVGVYSSDAIQRHATALQKTPDALKAASVAMHSKTARTLNLLNVQRVNVIENGHSQVMSLCIDDGVPENCIGIALGVPGSDHLAAAFGPIQLQAL